MFLYYVCSLLLVEPLLAASLPLFQRPQFGNGMILQRGDATRVFGSNAKGRIRVTVAVPGKVDGDCYLYIMCMRLFTYYLYSFALMCMCTICARLWRHTWYHLPHITATYCCASPFACERKMDGDLAKN